MDISDKMANINPVRLGPKSKFKFQCHPGVKCFTKCCRGINIILTPYDIIRLKNRLDLPSEEFLTLYTEPQILEKTGLPVVTLKLLEDEAASDDADRRIARCARSAATSECRRTAPCLLGGGGPW